MDRTMDRRFGLISSTEMSHVYNSERCYYYLSLDNLQRIHNSTARIISRTPSTQHITPVINQLHWLPAPLCINFKILLLTFKALHTSPFCLINLPNLHLKDFYFYYNFATLGSISKYNTL